MPTKITSKKDLVTVFPDITIRLSDFKNSASPKKLYEANKTLLQMYYDNPELTKKEGWTINKK